MLQYNHSPLDLIRARTSVRRFSGEILADKPRKELESCCHALTRGPLGSSCRFRLVDSRSRNSDRGERVGSYGLISGAAAYLAGAVTDGDHALEDFGYLFELLLLKATDLNLGSCWLGGTFSRGRFARVMGLRENELLPAVSPVGIPTRRRSMVDKVIRWGAGSRQRKPWKELFYDAETATPLSEDRAGLFALALEMIRLAPSASNRQPWRCLVEGETIHLFIQRLPGYRAVLSTDLQRIDMGIAMSHLDLAMAAAGIQGCWHVLDPLSLSQLQPSKARPEAWQKAQYLVSWMRKSG